MKKVVILGSLDSGTKNNPYTLSQHLRSKGYDVDVYFWEHIVFDIKTGNVKISSQSKDIAADMKPDLVIALGWYKQGSKSFYRDVAYATSLYLKHHNIPFWNSEMGQQRSTTKLSCMVQLALRDIAVPSTLFAIDGSLIEIPEPPFIAKAISASRGESNFLITSRAQAKDLLKDETNKYIVQPFMPNDHDLRVICFGGEPSLVLKRSRKEGSESHLNNTSQGGNAEWLNIADIDEKLLTVSREICIIMGREMGGIDFIPDSSSPFGYSCLEVNAIPQLTSGHDTLKKLDILAESILKL